MWYKKANNKITVYHGTKTHPGLGQKSGYYPGTYTSILKDDAATRGNVHSAIIDINKIYNLDSSDADNLKDEARNQGFEHHLGNGASEVEYLKSKGFIGMRRGNEIILFDNADAEFTSTL
jgi:hypothetical protein